jgi:hypothetical protein
MAPRTKLKEVAEDTAPEELFEAVVIEASPANPKGDIWTRVFLEQELALRDPQAQLARTRVAWRITRAMAILQGRIDAMQPLDDLTDHDKPRTTIGLNALPVSIRGSFTSEMTLFPSDEKSLAAHASLAYMLNCSMLMPDDPQMGSQSFWGLLHPSYYEALFPSLLELQVFERKILHRCLRYLVRNGSVRTFEWLRNKHMLTVGECKALMGMARIEARNIVEYEQEEERAVMTLRLQDHQERSRKEGNLREELQSMKQEAIVRGLTATQPEGFLDVFSRVVETTSKKHLQPGSNNDNQKMQAQIPRSTGDDNSGGSEEDPDE